MKISVKELRKMIHEEVELEQAERIEEVAPPGKEKQVLGIKKAIKRGDIPKTYIDPKTHKRKETNPWAIAWSQNEGEDDDDYACPGCGCLPGEGRTKGCDHPDGCGFQY